MNDLDQQIQVLIDGAPQDDRTPQAVAAIGPILKVIAERLRHRQYYIVQTSDQEWLTTILSHRTQPGQEKRVVYAYPTLEDAMRATGHLADPRLMALPLPIVHILFQLLSLVTVDSLVFFDTPGNTEVGTEVQRQELQTLCQSRLQPLIQSPPSNLA
ncbi:hypothetical protein [Trichothermofontia sp.]